MEHVKIIIYCVTKKTPVSSIKKKCYKQDSMMTLQIKPEINKVPIKTLKTFIKQLLSERGKILTHKFKKQ